MATAYNTWVSGVASSYANNYHVKNYVAAHTTIQNSYFYNTLNAGTQSYGIGGGICGDILVVNNVVQAVTDPLNLDAACPGAVFAYNFAVNDYDTTSAYSFGSHSYHAAGISYALSEGNIGNSIDIDGVHGTHNMDTFFRNYFNGYESNGGTMPTDNTSPIHLAAFSRYMNVIANVLGTPGRHTTYACIPASSSTSSCSGKWVDIYDLGWSGNTWGELDISDPPSPNDTLVPPTLLRWGNWDVVTYNSGTTNGIRWCATSSDTGWSTNCSSTSEIPTGDSYYPNSNPTVGDTGAGQGALPASFYYSSKPSWWPSGKAWPSIGPDITGGNIGQCQSGTYQWSKVTSSGQCSGGTFLAASSTNSSLAISNPAMDCYLNTMGGTPDGTGGQLTFSADTCYSLLGGGTKTGPTAMAGPRVKQ
jgi:hypothetical protein